MGATPRWLNYHQLQCFRVVAQEGSLARAGSVLRISAQTLSEHIQQLEGSLGLVLFARGARGMTLTDAGREVLAYAEEMHALGQELLGTVDGLGGRVETRLRVGLDESLSKVEAWSLLAPGAATGTALVVREGAHDDLLPLLRARSLDLVLSERPVLAHDDPALRCVRLRDEAVAWFAAAPLADRLRAGFPQSLDGAPVLLAAHGTALRRAAEGWMVTTGYNPRVVGEFSDTSLAKAACADGVGVMLLPVSVTDTVAMRYGLHRVGPCEGGAQEVFAITPERRAAHPAVAAMLAAAEADDGIS